MQITMRGGHLWAEWSTLGGDSHRGWIACIDGEDCDVLCDDGVQRVVGTPDSAREFFPVEYRDHGVTALFERDAEISRLRDALDNARDKVLALTEADLHTHGKRTEIAYDIALALGLMIEDVTPETRVVEHPPTDTRDDAFGYGGQDIPPI